MIWQTDTKSQADNKFGVKEGSGLITTIGVALRVLLYLDLELLIFNLTLQQPKMLMLVH